MDTATPAFPEIIRSNRRRKTFAVNMNNKGYDSGIVRERAASRRACTKELLFFGAQLPELGCPPTHEHF